MEHVFSKANNISVDAAAGNKPQKKGDIVKQEWLFKVLAEQAANYIGKMVSVCDKVYSAKSKVGIGVTFINRGGEYPKNSFTPVIMANNCSHSNYKPEEYLNGKTICVIGSVKEYKGKPEIVFERQE